MAEEDTNPPHPPPSQETPSPPPIKTDGRTILRKGLTPYLPPPVVKAMNDLDPVLEPYVGPEASITLASTLLFGFLLLRLLRILGGLSRGGKAIADDDEEDNDIHNMNNSGLLLGNADRKSVV